MEEVDRWPTKARISDRKATELPAQESRTLGCGAAWSGIDAHNVSIGSNGPQIDTAPLPARAQFLNVIESVFSGMARAIIHNSNYGSIDEAKAAIDRYFCERNAHFKGNPRRAGGKLWGKEREPAEFSPSNNCKDPRFG
ncbi:hypothetical protein [Bradyrhizobium sp. USDA 4454]